MKHTYPGFENNALHQHRILRRERVRLADGVWGFMGYASSNFAAIATEHGYVLVDTGDDLTWSAEARKEIAELAPGTLQAIILTHSHPDHRGGASAFLEGTENVPVYGHHAFGSEQRDGAGLGDILAARAQKQFGRLIPDGQYHQNALLPRLGGKPGPLACPTVPVEEGCTALCLDGVSFELHTLPTESADHMAVWLPEKKVLFCGDAVYGSFPNVYPLRGGTYRDIERWIRGVRRLPEFGAEAMLCGHTMALFGGEIARVCARYADALEYVYNAAIAGLNAGKTADELAAEIRLPEDMAQEPFLGEFYGCVPWTVREICAAKVGWFNGDPADIVPLAPREEAERMADLAGGPGALMDKASRALMEEDYRWAAKLAGYVLALDEGCREAMLVRASSLEVLADEILPITGVNYLRSCALELRKKAGDLPA